MGRTIAFFCLDARWDEVRNNCEQVYKSFHIYLLYFELSHLKAAIADESF
jgi:hypothetical protein